MLSMSICQEWSSFTFGSIAIFSPHCNMGLTREMQTFSLPNCMLFLVSGYSAFNFPMPTPSDYSLSEN